MPCLLQKPDCSLNTRYAYFLHRYRWHCQHRLDTQFHCCHQQAIHIIDVTSPCRTHFTCSDPQTKSQVNETYQNKTIVAGEAYIANLHMRDLTLEQPIVLLKFIAEWDISNIFWPKSSHMDVSWFLCKVSNIQKLDRFWSRERSLTGHTAMILSPEVAILFDTREGSGSLARWDSNFQS